MDTKATLVAAWFGTAWTALVFATVFFIYSSTPKVVTWQTQDFRLYAALPQRGFETVDNITHSDGRAKIVENFFQGYKSLLANYSGTFIKVADKYGLDYRLLPAIAMQESNGAKKVIKDSKNPFGWGIYGSLVVKFTSWEEAIERVGRSLKEDYLNQGLTTPQTIMTKYNPPSLTKGNIWAKGVSSFMEQLR
ncbi:glucosaminidase domain-containing protein [Candidatus Microgenomates bacterium]|nr:glucosaminidase domain-containing protein [Candidatus Microgenomates bacterium]MBI2039477.1 glucosaminidase domain-containing protein [Candidatus Microgenomates bacterium]